MLHKSHSMWLVYFLYVATIFLSTILQVHAADDDTCSFCPASHYCTQGGKKSCPVDSSGPPQQSLKTACTCDPGFYGTITLDEGDSGGTCETCPIGSFCTGGSHIEVCHDFSSSPAKSTSADNCICVDTHWEPSALGSLIYMNVVIHVFLAHRGIGVETETEIDVLPVVVHL
jgi:hypothetical protein